MVIPPPHARALRVSDLCLDPTTRHVQCGERPVRLCPVEYELLRALMGHAGRPVTPAELAAWLHGVGHATASTAVVVHIHHLRRKIGPDRIRTLRGRGYLMPCQVSHW